MLFVYHTGALAPLASFNLIHCTTALETWDILNIHVIAVFRLKHLHLLIDPHKLLQLLCKFPVNLFEFVDSTGVFLR